jgi:hypothetical protein
MPVYALSLLIQIAIIVHIFKTGRNIYWVWVVFVPIVGPLAYFIVEILPELGNYRAVRKANKAILDKVAPNRDINLHSDALEVADTIDNTLNLARALKDRGLYNDALVLYNKAQTGMYKHDPHILLGKAEIFFQKNDYLSAKNTLDELIEKNPDFKSAEGHLLYAKSLEGIGEIEKAKQEYETLCKYYAGPEPKCHYARLLKAAGENGKAMALYNEVIAASKRSGSHYNQLHKEWVNTAKQAVKH